MSFNPKLTACAIGFAAMIATGAGAGTYISAPLVKDSQGIAIGGINNNNVIVGYYADANNTLHGFYGTLNGKYKTFDYTGENVVGTIPRNINDGNVIVGYAQIGGFDCNGGLEFYRGSDGKAVAIAKKGKDMMGISQGLNNANTSVGDYFNAKCTTRTPFKAKKGSYSADLSTGLKSKVIVARGLNKAGEIVGYYSDSDGGVHGFVLSKGNVTQIDYPSKNAVQTLLEDINDNDTAVGQWIDKDGNQFGFTLDVKTKKYTSVLPKGSSISQVTGLNNAGFLAINTDVGNYIYCPLTKSQCDKVAKGKVASLGPVIVPAPGSTLRYIALRKPIPTPHYPASVHLMVP